MRVTTSLPLSAHISILLVGLHCMVSGGRVNEYCSNWCRWHYTDRCLHHSAHRYLYASILFNFQARSDNICDTNYSHDLMITPLQLPIFGTNFPSTDCCSVSFCNSSPDILIFTDYKISYTYSTNINNNMNINEQNLIEYWTIFKCKCFLTFSEIGDTKSLQNKKRPPWNK